MMRVIIAKHMRSVPLYLDTQPEIKASKAQGKYRD